MFLTYISYFHRQIALKALSERLSKNTDHHSSKDRQPLLPKSSPKVTFMNPPNQSASGSVNIAFTQDKSDPQQPGTSKLSNINSPSQQTSQQQPSRVSSQTYVPTTQTLPRSTSLAFVPQTTAQMSRSASASYVPQLASQQSTDSSHSKSAESST